MKRASNWFEKIYEDIIFDYFNITLFVHISVYYIYYYTYLYLYILSICTIYITIETFRNLIIKKSYNRLHNIYNNAFRRIFELVGYNATLSPVISTFITQPKANYQRIKMVRFSKLIKGKRTC
jgi:hypothetical protein